MQQQQTGIDYQQAVMMEPPEIMSTKDHLYVKDMLSWNLLAMKKMHFFAQQCQNPDVKEALEQVGLMHDRHYQLLLQQMQQYLNQPSQNISQKGGDFSEQKYSKRD